MNTASKIARNTLVLTISDISGKILSMVLVISIARCLGDIGLGKYSFAFSFVSFFMIFAELGLSTLAIRDVSRNKSLASKYLNNMIFIKLILSILIFGLIVISINLMRYSFDTTMAVYIIGLSMIIGSFSNSFKAIFNAYEQMQYSAMITLFGRITFAILGILILYNGYGLIALVITFLIANFFDLLLSIYVTAKKFAKPKIEIDYALGKYLIKTSIAFVLTGIFASIYFYIATIMLSVIKGDAVVGWYNGAYNLLSAIIPILGIFTTAIFPVFSRSYTTSEENLNFILTKSIDYLLILTLPIVTGTTLISENIIYFFYGEAFSYSIVPLQILIWALLFISMNLILSTLLNSIDKQVLVTKATAIGAIINVGLNSILIPKMSLIGASIVIVITEFVLFLMYFYFTSKYLFLIPVHKLIYKPIVAVILMSIFILYFKHINVFSTVLLSSIIYFGVLFAIGGVGKDDIDLFKKVMGIS